MNQIDVEAMRALARKTAMSLGNLEKDYVLSVALTRLPGLTEHAIFKGGTCIKKCYYPKFRFSSDLDFTYQNKNPDDLKTLKNNIRGTFEMKTIDGIRFQKVKPIETLKENLIAAIQYESVISQTGYIDSIRVEYSTETPVEQKPCLRNVINPPVYDLPQTTVPCLSLPEILAEKIHAIYHRKKPRDLYDATFLIRQGVTPDQKLIATKLKALGAELGKPTLQERIGRLKETWNDDTARLVLIVPDVAESEKTLIDKLFEK